MAIRATRSRGFGLTAVALAMAIGPAACTRSGAGSDPTAPASASLGRPKALFVAGIGDRAAWRLHAVDPDSTIRRVVFRNADGAPLGVAVDQVAVLSADWVWLGISGVDEVPPARAPYPSAVLVRVEDGRIFDARLFSAALPQVKGGQLYSRGDPWGTAAVRVDLASMEVSRLNDPSVDPVGSQFVVDRWGNYRAMVWDGARREQRIFFAGGAPSIADPWGRAESWQAFCDGQLALMYGEDQDLYALCQRDTPDPVGSTTSMRREFFVRKIDFTADGSRFVDQLPFRTTRCTGSPPSTVACPDPPLGVRTSSSLRPRSRVLPYETGFFELAPVPAGGVSVAWTDLSLPAAEVLSDGHGYWASWDTIFRIRLEPGAAPEEVATAPHPLLSWHVAGGVAIFTTSRGGDLVSWSVSGPGADPALLGTNVPVQAVADL